MEPIFLADIPPDEPETSRSAETIRQLPTHIAAMSLLNRPDSPHLSPPASPHSSYPSPSSPSSESVSSLPSVSSSFLFSSAPGSPPHAGLALHHAHELGDSSLIIPSLALPAAVRRPTPFGQTLGDVRLLVLGHVGAGAEGVAQVFADMEECEDVVDGGEWEDIEGETSARVLRVSTDWIEHRDAHGLEKHEPSRNLEILLMQDYGPVHDMEQLLRSVLQIVHGPFQAINSILDPEHPPSALLANLLSSPTSPLHTALVLIPSHQLTPSEQRLITELSTHIPIILLPNTQLTASRNAPLHHHSPYPRRPSLHDPHPHPPASPLHNAKLPPLRPHSARALRTALLRSPDTLAALRTEAADRFLRWREVERAVRRVLAWPAPTPAHPQPQEHQPRSHGRTRGWDKARWEAEWEGALATDVARTLRARRGAVRRETITARPRPRVSPVCSAARSEDEDEQNEERPSEEGQAYFDPLHLPSLIAFTLSLLGPLKARVARVVAPAGGGGVGWAVVGAFCAGVGVGIVLSRGV